MSKQAQVIGIECTSPPQIYAVQKSPQMCIDQKEEQGTIPRQSLIVLNFLFPVFLVAQPRQKIDIAVCNCQIAEDRLTS